MKVGDLVRWNKTYAKRGLVVVVKVAAEKNLLAVGMVHIQWADGKQTKNWYKEVEVVSESR